MAKNRLDILLVSRGLAPSREKAKALIMSGDVFVAGQRASTPGAAFGEGCEIEVRSRPGARYVSRGGLKLEKALAAFGVDPAGLVCLDCGASTGGFTDCLLKNGAEKVYAVDVGYGQLAWEIRNDPRVVVMERTNIRTVTDGQIPDKLDLAAIDVSFISLKLVLPVLRGLLKDGGEALCLIKPQFEAGRGKVGKKGVVRDRAVHLEVLEQFRINAAEADFSVLGLDWSPVTGPEGNIEYLGHLVTGRGNDRETNPGKVVEESHRTLRAGGGERIEGEEP